MDSKWMQWRTRQRVPASSVPVRAQHLYDDMVKRLISPGLRQLGFTGSGGRYSLRADGCWSLLGLQKSVYSDGHEVRFTANLMVANKETWAGLRAEKPYLPERPAPGTLYGDQIAQKRIGSLLPAVEDTWWRVYDGVDLDAVANDVITGIGQHGLPWMRGQMAQQGCAE
jgi:hypothetical protein